MSRTASRNLRQARQQTLRVWRTLALSPAGTVLGMALLVGAGVPLARWWAQRTAQSPAQFMFLTPQTGVSASTRPVATAQERDPLAGEPYQTAVRVREMAATALAAMLAALAQAQEHKQLPADTPALLAAMQARQLLPPGVTRQGPALGSQSGILFVRYQAHPLQVEVLTQARNGPAGPLLLLRAPEAEIVPAGLRYYQYAKLSSAATLPAPFTPMPELLGQGWEPQTLRASGEKEIPLTVLLERVQTQMRAAPPDGR